MLFCSAIANAADLATAFNDANKLYEQGKFRDAAANYEKIIQSGSTSSTTFFNLGNAYLKSGQVGRAMVAYRSAQKLSPRDSNVRSNLQFARNQAGGGDPAPTKRFQNVLGTLTLNEWTVLTAVPVSLFFVALALRQWRGKEKNAFNGLILSLGILSAVFVLCLAVVIRYEFYTQFSVVIVPEAVVRRGTFEESPSVFTLRDGAEVTVLDKNNGWLQIVDAAGRSGWMLDKQLMSLP